MGANADTVKDGWDAFSRGDMDAATATTSDSAEIVIPESLPWGGTYTGPAGFKEMIGKFVSNFDEVHPEPQQFLEADDGHVLVTVSGTGTTKSGNELGGDSIWRCSMQQRPMTRRWTGSCQQTPSQVSATVDRRDPPARSRQVAHRKKKRGDPPCLGMSSGVALAS